MGTPAVSTLPRRGRAVPGAAPSSCPLARRSPCRAPPSSWTLPARGSPWGGSELAGLAVQEASCICKFTSSVRLGCFCPRPCHLSLAPVCSDGAGPSCGFCTWLVFSSPAFLSRFLPIIAVFVPILVVLGAYLRWFGSLSSVQHLGCSWEGSVTFSWCCVCTRCEDWWQTGLRAGAPRQPCAHGCSRRPAFPCLPSLLPSAFGCPVVGVPPISSCKALHPLRLS